RRSPSSVLFRRRRWRIVFPYTTLFRSESGDLFDGCDGDAGGLDRPGGRPGRHDRHPGGVQRRGEVGQPGLVVDGDQGALERTEVGHRGSFGWKRMRRPSISKGSRAIRPTHSTSMARSRVLMRSCRVSTSSSSSTGTATWATIGPVSTPSSTTNRVAPVIL